MSRVDKAIVEKTEPIWIVDAITEWLRETRITGLNFLRQRETHTRENES